VLRADRDCFCLASVELGSERGSRDLVDDSPDVQPLNGPTELRDDSRWSNRTGEEARKQRKLVDAFERDQTGAVDHDRRHQSPISPANSSGG
jgi:hypothetical protein